jgi:drug/metabolite transporter (DMT)-like permease
MGEFFALAAALVWGLAVIMFKKSGERVGPFQLNLFRVVISVPIFLLILKISGQSLIQQVPPSDYIRLILSGIIGIAISDTLFHKSLNLVGAGINAILDCSYSPFVALLAFLMLGEKLSPVQLGGMILVIGAILLTTRMTRPVGLSQKDLLLGIGLGVTAMATVALGIVIAKPVLENSSVVWATTIRQLACFAVMVPVALISSRRRSNLAVFIPSSTWRYSLTGTLLGSCLALLFWIAGMKYTQVNLAAILNQTSTIFILLFATLLLKERFTRRKLVATLVAISGIVLVVIG